MPDDISQLLADLLAETVDEVLGEPAEELIPSTAQPPPDTAWRPLPPLPRTFIRCPAETEPPGGSWRRRGGITFTATEIRSGVHLQYGWVAIADGRPLLDHSQARFIFVDEQDAQQFCDGLDPSELGDHQL